MGWYKLNKYTLHRYKIDRNDLKQPMSQDSIVCSDLDEVREKIKEMPKNGHTLLAWTVNDDRSGSDGKNEL